MKMPTIFGIFLFISRESSCSVEHEKSFITSGPSVIVFTLSKCFLL